MMPSAMTANATSVETRAWSRGERRGRRCDDGCLRCRDATNDVRDGLNVPELQKHRLLAENQEQMGWPRPWHADELGCGDAALR